MDVSPAAYATWFTAFAAVFSLYAHTLLGLPPGVITPVLAFGIAGGLYLVTVLEAERLHVSFGGGRARLASIAATAIALVAMTASTIAEVFTRGLSVQDWGLFGVQVGVPVLLVLNPRRLELIAALGAVCAVFALADAGANLLAAGHLVSLNEYSARRDADGLLLRYPGLTGNTHAAGMVAMVAVFSLAMRLLRAPRARRLMYALAMAAIFTSMILIDARRYTGMAMVGVGLILAAPARRIPPALTVVAIAGSAVWATLHNVFDPGDDLRARLMISGFAKALGHPFLGGGAAYINPDAIQPGYAALTAAGITESGALDLAIAYGVLAAALLIAACILALSARRRLQSTPVVLLTMLTAELAFGDPLTGFLGAILFYACLTYLQQDEAEIESRHMVGAASQMAIAH